MQLTYTPSWYELDQPIQVGQKDRFYIDKDKKAFSNGFISDNDIEIEGTITKIYHTELGEMKELNTKGLSYKFIRTDGTYLKVEAEETPGEIEGETDLNITNWDFTVEIENVLETGFTSKQRWDSSK